LVNVAAELKCAQVQLFKAETSPKLAILTTERLKILRGFSVMKVIVLGKRLKKP